MLLNSFYTIDSIDSANDQIKALLVIDRNHDILKGHFPGQPVVPGVCMMQMIRELVEVDRKKKFRIVEADQVKFLSIIDPTQNNRVEASISFQQKDLALAVTASLTAGAVTYFKLKAVLQSHS
jgi:3-hydroxyacyl-[acyl-carrier-protein] dehydratase